MVGFIFLILCVPGNFYLMADNIDLALLSVRYFYIPVEIFEFSHVM